MPVAYGLWAGTKPRKPAINSSFNTPNSTVCCLNSEEIRASRLRDPSIDTYTRTHKRTGRRTAKNVSLPRWCWRWPLGGGRTTEFKFKYREDVNDSRLIMRRADTGASAEFKSRIHWKRRFHSGRQRAPAAAGARYEMAEQADRQTGWHRWRRRATPTWFTIVTGSIPTSDDLSNYSARSTRRDIGHCRLIDRKSPLHALADNCSKFT